MMRTAYFGTNSLILLGIHLLLFSLDAANVMEYVRTLFYPMFNLLALMLSVLGLVERDKKKTPALIATLLWTASLIFWVVALVLRIQSGP